MPKFFDVTDANDSSPASTTADTGKVKQAPFDVGEVGAWTMKFDKDATEDLDRLLGDLARVNSREEAVYAALQILAFAVEQDVVIKGKQNGTPQQVNNLWKKK